MPFIRTSVLPFLSFVTVGILASACNCGPPALIHQASYIELEPLALDFGPVPLGLSAELPVSIRNLGRKELLIDPAEFDGSDFSGPVDPLRLAPGETVAISIAFSPSASGTRTATLHFVNNAQNDPDATIQLVGVGVSNLTCGDCNSPPANYCAGASTLVSYSKIGSCQGNMCLYESSQTVCGGMCNAATAMCQSGAGGGGGATSVDSGTGGGVGGGGADAGLTCVDGRVRACVATTCGSGGQTCSDNAWGPCEPCKTFDVGAQCVNGSCCSAAGTTRSYCTTQPEEAAGLSVGVTITPTFSNPYVTQYPRRCCSKKATVVGVNYATCTTYGSWEIRCD